MRLRRRPAPHRFAAPVPRGAEVSAPRGALAPAWGRDAWPNAWLDRVAVVGFASVWTAAAARQLAQPASFAHLAAQAAGGVAGYLLADLVAGIVHWLADRHLDPRMPVVGPILIAPFRAHHDDPLSITRHDLFEVLGHNALVTLPVALGLLAAPLPSTALGAFFGGLGLLGSLAAVLTNLFHAWAHAPRPPRLARWLQHHRLVLTPRAHARHHRAPHDRAYCVTSGWLNPLLDRTRFFARLDARLDARRSARREACRSAGTAVRADPCLRRPGHGERGERDGGRAR